VSLFANAETRLSKASQQANNLGQSFLVYAAIGIAKLNKEGCVARQKTYGGLQPI
jgi:hypothetical protein